MLNFDDNSDNFFVQTNTDQNDEFINRQKSVFEKLDAVVKDKESTFETKISPKRPMITEDRKSYKKQRNDTKQFRGQESIFLRPEAPPPSRFKRNIPDYLRHPRKWTKYTLSDVSMEDMSDRTNTAAAMSFLRELKAKKEFESMEVDNDVKQITFKKPLSYRQQEIEASNSSESSIFRSSKVIMPEYVVGEKKKSKKNPRIPADKIGRPKEIKLDHLEEEDEGEL